MPKNAPLLLQNLVDKEPNDLHVRFADWIERNSGCEVDLKTVQLVTASRMMFQKSDENQKHLAERREAAERAKEEKAARMEERENKRAEKAAARELKAKEPKPLTKKKAAPAKDNVRPLRGAAKKAAPAKKVAPVKKAVRKKPAKAAEADF